MLDYKAVITKCDQTQDTTACPHLTNAALKTNFPMKPPKTDSVRFAVVLPKIENVCEDDKCIPPNTLRPALSPPVHGFPLEKI